MTDPARIVDMFRIPNRHLRSVQLERDFRDPEALDDYVVTSAVRDAFARIADGVRRNSGRRAWRITGDYGVGKSAFALALAHTLDEGDAATDSRIAAALGWTAETSGTLPLLVPVLLTGSRAPLVPSVARSIGSVILDRKADGRRARLVGRVAELVAEAEATGSVAALEALVAAVRERLAKEGRGLLLIVDELGKHLEFAASRPETEDVFVLQRLAEAAARSGDRPFVLVALLHQGFQAYAERLPPEVRHEWDKVAGRFDEIVFDQPLAHAAAIVAGALGVRADRLPKPVVRVAAELAACARGTGWYGRAASDRGASETAACYPIHPLLLPVMVRFFGRYGQNERSLFGFLLSGEPLGLQAFAGSREATAEAWYGLPDFYDYVRASFGHRLAGGSYRSQWLRILSVVDAAADAGELELRVLKTVGLLALLDADDLPATTEVVRAALAPTGTRDVDRVLADLKRDGALFERGRGGSLRLWPSSSVALDTALAAAARALGPVGKVAAGLDERLDREPVLARRHYVQTGTMRFFDVRYVTWDALEAAAADPVQADGSILVALADTEAERQAALATARGAAVAARPELLVCVPEPLAGLAPELHELRTWRWVADNTPELVEDAYAAAEVFRQVETAGRALDRRLRDAVGMRGGATTGATWLRHGREIGSIGRGGVSATISSVCDELFTGAPLIANELLNRNQPSSAAAAARMRLIEGVLASGDEPYLGMDPDKSPPEKSMYLSVLRKGGIHREEDGRFAVREPDAEDRLRLRPALDRIVELVVEARGERVPVVRLMQGLSERPYGVRAGVAPLLLAVVFRLRAHEFAFYERGTFLPRLGPADFLRLTKAPATFEVQLCRVEGVRLEVFRRLSDAFAAPGSAGSTDLLDVVRPLCRFAAELPEHTRRTRDLGPAALAVRDALLAAREPSTLLFSSLPSACGIDPPSMTSHGPSASVDLFAERLQEAIAELRGAYPRLLNGIVATVAGALGVEGEAFDRTRLASAAADLATVVREPRLRTFVGRLRDPGLSDDAWAEALASFVVSKPPSRWTASDEASFGTEIATLAKGFRRAEAASFAGPDGRRVPEAMLVELTRGDGRGNASVLRPDPMDGVAEKFVAIVKDVLPHNRALRMRVLAEMMWAEMLSDESEPGEGLRPADGRSAWSSL